VAVPGAAPDPALSLQARPDEEAARTAWVDARRRFLLLVAALVSVVALGFVFLMRGVRKEVALARRKEDFVAAVTHELKTPLTGIRMYAEMLEQGWVADGDAAQEHARRIIEECGRLGHLVDQVLDLAALERGVTGPNLVRGDLGAAVAAAVGLLHSRAEGAGVPLTVTVAPDLPDAPFDPRLVRPLVLNLVENAIKYSERAPVKDVRVLLEKSGDRLVLTVKDRGVGIAPEAQRSLFQPFHRGGDEMTRAAPGVGIGLALVKRYAEVHRAKVNLESAPGEGTTVTVKFPV
jgi:signal transduction histidine kinase